MVSCDDLLEAFIYGKAVVSCPPYITARMPHGIGVFITYNLGATPPKSCYALVALKRPTLLEVTLDSDALPLGEALWQKLKAYGCVDDSDTKPDFSGPKPVFVPLIRDLPLKRNGAGPLWRGVSGHREPETLEDVQGIFSLDTVHVLA